MPFDSVINQINQHADNSGFIAALDEDLYEPRPNQVNLIKAILLRLDMEQQDESVIKTYTGRITIEHILPQALVNEYWINRFQPQEHVYWLHKIGNLTLISGSKILKHNTMILSKRNLFMRNLIVKALLI